MYFVNIKGRRPKAKTFAGKTGGSDKITIMQTGNNFSLKNIVNRISMKRNKVIIFVRQSYYNIFTSHPLYTIQCAYKRKRELIELFIEERMSNCLALVVFIGNKIHTNRIRRGKDIVSNERKVSCRNNFTQTELQVEKNEFEMEKSFALIVGTKRKFTQTELKVEKDEFHVVLNCFRSPCHHRKKKHTNVLGVDAKI